MDLMQETGTEKTIIEKNGIGRIVTYTHTHIIK